jgi:5-methylcytosine-specific restriction endonuclease McrBC GTP-binding regulatory subunit McrB
LLDRDKNGYSEYRIKADHDLKDYLVEHLPEDSEGIKDGKLCLPPNLSIIASMNTSDQSLFPMDSAFKRRWSWEYVPIDYENAESSKFEITIGDESYNWHKFLKAVNEKIKNVTSSEDKQMGNFFIKSSIDEKEFCDKVMFYLWSEIGKDNYNTKDAIFKYYVEEDKQKEFSFNELYDLSKRTEILKGFISYIEEEK